MIAGQVFGPIVIGTVADNAGFETAFVTVSGFLIAAAAMVVVFGVETRQTTRRADEHPP